MTISTIIISYNTAELTTKAILSVLENYTSDKIDGEIIVVDNNSSDHSVSEIKKQFGKKVILIENKKNIGFAQANNQAMKTSKGKFFLLLNSDAQLHESALKNLLNVFKKYPDNISTAELQGAGKEIDRVGMVSGQLLNADGSIQPQGGALPKLFNLSVWWLWPFPGSDPLPVQNQYHIQDHSFFKKESKMGWLAGTALLVRKEMIDEIGMLDTDIFMYAEDVEWCIRANNHHWDCVYTPQSKITHLGSASSASNESLAREIESLLYVTAKHWSYLQYLLIIWVFRLGAILRWLLFGIIAGDEKKQTLYSRIFKSTFEKAE